MANGFFTIAASREVFFDYFKIYPNDACIGFPLNNDGETIMLCKPDMTIHDIVYINGGSDDFPVTQEWGSIKLPNAAEGESVQRKGFSLPASYSDWTNGEPSPGCGLL
jgi:hypothetical protein